MLLLGVIISIPVVSMVESSRRKKAMAPPPGEADENVEEVGEEGEMLEPMAEDGGLGDPGFGDDPFAQPAADDDPFK